VKKPQVHYLTLLARDHFVYDLLTLSDLGTDPELGYDLDGETPSTLPVMVIERRIGES